MEELTVTSLTDSQQKFLVQLFAKKTLAYDEIQDRFTRFFGQPITGPMVLAAEEQLQKDIQAHMQDMSNRPLAHVGHRLDKIQEGLDQASRMRTVRIETKIDPITGQETQENFEDMDHLARARYIQLAREEEIQAKKLMLDLLKLDIEATQIKASGPPVITISADET